MIGLSFLIGIALWTTVAIMISRRVPRWFRATRHATAVSVLAFPLVLVAPIADDLIGRWQFYRLCEREAVITLSPDWKKVKRAGERKVALNSLEGYVIPIRSQRNEYTDLDSGETFVTYQAFHTSGGLLQRNLYGLGSSTSCHPNTHDKTYSEAHLQSLLNRGK